MDTNTTISNATQIESATTDTSIGNTNVSDTESSLDKPKVLMTSNLAIDGGFIDTLVPLELETEKYIMKFWCPRLTVGTVESFVNNSGEGDILSSVSKMKKFVVDYVRNEDGSAIFSSLDLLSSVPEEFLGKLVKFIFAHMKDTKGVPTGREQI